MKKIIKWLVQAIFKIQSPFRMAIASSLGLLAGMLPLVGIRIPLLLAISCLLRLNFFALLAGLAFTLFFPYLHLLAYHLASRLGGITIPAFNLKVLSFNLLLQPGEVSAHQQLIGGLLLGSILSLLAFPLFKWFYSSREQYNEKSHDYKFVFNDLTGKRWSSTKRLVAFFTGVFVVLIALFGFSISVNPFLPYLGLQSAKNLAHISTWPLSMNPKSKTYHLTHHLTKLHNVQIDYKHRNRKKVTSQNGSTTSVQPQKQWVYGFFVDWDENSFISLKQNIRHMDVVLPNWYELKTDGGLINHSTEKVDALIKGYGVRNMPVVNNFVNNKWDSDLIHKIVSNPSTKQALIQSLVKDALAKGYYGVNLDFESILPSDRAGMTLFVKDLCTAFHSKGLKVSMDVTPDNPAYDTAALADQMDTVIVMMYDEHYQTGAAGPIASQKWFEKTLDALDIPAEKLVVALGSYGYDWNISAGGSADAVTFGDVLEMVNGYKLDIKWDEASGNPYLAYNDSGENHIIWLLDGATLYNQVNYAIGDGIAGAAVWRLGSEDPTIWNSLGDLKNLKANVDKLQVLTSPTPVHYSGQGEILRIMNQGRPGSRDVKFLDGPDKIIERETYKTYPEPYEVERYGKPKGKELVLTFDDGPDAEYTPQILDVLKKYNVKATFFVVGENGAANPDLIERIYREGHELGNHTYTHPNVAEVTGEQTKLELNTTQRLVQELTGHAMVMFRPPYVADAEPSTPNELSPILKAQAEGYMMIGELIDPSDWERPSSEEIVKRIIKELPSGNIILLHDAGGNRENTVKALPVIIETLQKQGYSFVTVHDLIGKSKDALMPPVSSSEGAYLPVAHVLFDVTYLWHVFIKYLFLTAILLGIFRLIFLVYYSWREKRRDALKTFGTSYQPKVTVVIAAYNEEKVINKTIASVLQSTYGALEILVINDGSKDRTSSVVTEVYGSHPKVRLIDQENGGKSSAVNHGYREATGEIVIGIDADTVLMPEAIANLVRHFENPKIAAVSGNIKVGNVHNLLTEWQHVEYVTGFNLERRAFAAHNCISVVPGAIGAWRKSVVEAAGYLKSDTLAEDTDLTITLLRQGYTIGYEEQAIAYTESPHNLSSLVKQRFRWSYGTLQCLWKHRDALFDPKMKALGFVALPNMWLFQYIFQSLSPLADIYFIIGLFGKSPGRIALFYGAFLVFDYLAAYYAFKLEGESAKPLWGLFFQRVAYRLLMAYIVLKSILAALKGITVGWNKLQRQGSVDQHKS